MIIDPIIYFKECNSYFFVPLHDGWHFTSVGATFSNPHGEFNVAVQNKSHFQDALRQYYIDLDILNAS